MSEKLQQSGKFSNLRIKNGSFGENYTTIDNIEYIGFLDVTKSDFPKIGEMVNFTYSTDPTILCHSPHITDCRPRIHSMINHKLR